MKSSSINPDFNYKNNETIVVNCNRCQGCFDSSCTCVSYTSKTIQKAMGDRLPTGDTDKKLNNLHYYTPCSLGSDDNTNAPMKKSRIRSAWKDEWRNFAENTTLHGLRYISMENAFLIRRFFWLVLVVACLIGMSYQILDRIIYYYSSPVNVNVKVNYNQSLIFPAITICNQNAFKATLATKNGWYRLIETMYNGTTRETVTDKLKDLNASHIKIDQLFIDAGHRKHDLIVECWWADKQCGADNFTTVLTDHGLCYTFNAPVSKDFEPETAKATGADHGLKLLLNVEQYEYMPGPNDAAGIKLLPHNHRHFPRVRELGISVPTGSHAFVGLQILEIENLEYPHGECKAKQLKYFNHYSYDSCQIECLTDQIDDTCGCRNFYMPELSGYPDVCTLQHYYDCFLPTNEISFKRLRKECDCPTPCHYYIYDPVLSYGTTSVHAAEKLLEMTDSSSLKRDLELARETSHKMEAKKYDQYTQVVSGVVKAFQNVKQLFTNNVIGKVSIQLDNVKQKYRKINRVWNKKSFLYRYQKYVLEKNFIRGRDAMEERTLSHLCDSFHEFVYFVETNINHLRRNESSSSNREVLYTLLTDKINNRIENAKRALANYTLLYEAYQNGTPIFRYKYYSIPRANNVYIVPKPLLAKALTHNYYARRYGPRMGEDIGRIAESLSEYLELADDVFVAGIVNVSMMQGISGQFIDACEDYYHSKSVFYFESVDWPIKIINQRMDKYKVAKAHYVAVRDSIISNLDNLRESIISTNTEVIQTFENIINISQAYLHFDNITKKTVANTVLSKLTEEAVEKCKQMFQEIRVRAQNVYDGWTQIVGKAVSLWQPVLKDDDMVEYYNFINYSQFLKNFSAVKLEIEAEYTMIRDKNDLRYLLGNEDLIFLTSFENMKGNLESFLKSTVVDENVLKNNFLQLDIFYRELNYEEITQQIAYDIFALLCDIGGSIGLFVGASFMTLFEIIDLFANSSARRLLKPN